MKILRVLLYAFVLQGYSCLESMVYDCFTFFNELDLLEIRFNELDRFVDRFVIVESIETFKGNEKPLYFLENRERFSKFSEKIIHIVLRERMPGCNPWEREFYQRNQIMRGLINCNDNDVVILSDVDEIVRGSLIPAVTSSLAKHPHSLFGFSQEMHRFFLNVYYEPSYPTFPHMWTGSVLTSFQRFKQLGPQEVRNLRGSDYIIQNGGWHFSSLGGMDLVRYKEANFSHEPWECWHARSFAHPEDHPVHLRKNRISEDYPSFVLNNLEYFHRIGFIYP